MAKYPTARPVSGEIMTVGEHRGRTIGRSFPGDVFDADYEIVPRRPMVEQPDAQISGITESSPVDRLAILSGSRPARSRFLAARGGVAFWSVGMTLIAAAFWVSGGHSVIVEGTSSPTGMSSSSVTLSDVVSRVDFSGDKPIIFVDGHLSNDSDVSAQIPGLEIRIADLQGLVTRYKLGTSSRNLGAGEQFAFSSRLDVPKNGLKTVAVTFAE